MLASIYPYQFVFKFWIFPWKVMTIKLFSIKVFSSKVLYRCLIWSNLLKWGMFDKMWQWMVALAVAIIYSLAIEPQMSTVFFTSWISWILLTWVSLHQKETGTQGKVVMVSGDNKYITTSGQLVLRTSHQDWSANRYPLGYPTVRRVKELSVWFMDSSRSVVKMEKIISWQALELHSRSHAVFPAECSVGLISFLNRKSSEWVYVHITL